MDAWNALRVFRLRTFSAETTEKVQPSARVVRGSYTRPNRRVGARILGLEADHSNKAKTPLTAGLVVEGREQIVAAVNEIRAASDQWSIRLNDSDFSLNDPRNQIMLNGPFTFAVTYAVLAIISGQHSMSQPESILGMVALTGMSSVFGPENLVRLAGRVDLRFNSFLALPDLEKMSATRWHWDSLNYRLSNTVVRNIWSQKNDEKLFFFDDMYVSAGLPFRWAMIHSPRFKGHRPDERGFVMIDRLIRWNPKTSEPQMLLFLRASTQPPHYPRVATKTEDELSDRLLPATGS